MKMISVIVPVYNVAVYLEDCVNSLLKQTYEDIEIILVDDGSTDESGQICDRFAQSDSRIVAYHKANGGLSSARNFGIEKAKGEWIIFIDSDDFLTIPEALGTLADYTACHAMDIVRYEYKEVDESGTESYENDIRCKISLENRVLSNYEMVAKAISGEWFAVLFLIRKSILGNYRFDEKRKFQEDIDFYARLFAAGDYRCGYYPGRFYAYRKRKGSITTTPKLSNLSGSFSLADVFISVSEKIKDKRLYDYYGTTAIMMYYRTLASMAEKPYSGMPDNIIRSLSIEIYRKSALQQLKQFKVANKYKLFVMLPPKVSIRAIILKNRLVRVLKILHIR